MTGPTTEVRVDGTRIVHDLPEDAYHGDLETFSASDAKALLELPSRFHYHRSNGGRPSKPAFDKGTAAHTVILEKGGRPVILDFPDWRTNAARAARAEATAAGRYALLRHEFRQTTGMRQAVRRHALARSLLYGEGESELSLYWPDPVTGVMLRARLDRLRRLRSGECIVVDLKTTGEGGAAPGEFTRTAARLRYHLSAAHYLAGAVATGLVGPETRFLHVVVEVTPPHPVTVAWLDERALEEGHRLMRRAVDRYQRYTLTGEWPDYADDVATISLPGWAFSDFVDEEG